MYNIYSSLSDTNRQHDVQQEIERISQRYRANITPGFDMSQFRLIRTLGQGMNGAVDFFFIEIEVHRFLNIGLSGEL